MSVLIKGMEMPQNCDACPMLYEYRFCALTDDHASSIEWKIEEKRMPNCPLVEIPDHGDLIDRDALMTRLGMAMDCEDCPNRTALYFCGLPREVMEVCDELENAPVVIPAERRASLCICDNCDKRNDKGCSVCKYINERSEDGEN